MSTNKRTAVDRTNSLRIFILAWMPVVAVCLGGCEAARKVEDFFKTDVSRFLDASKLIRTPDGKPINTILPSVGMTDQTEERLPNSTLPGEQDYVYDDKDYVIGPTDVVLVGVMDLFVEGQESQFQREVSATGYIDMPLLDERVKADGLDKESFKEAIKQAYSPEVILDPIVSVQIVAQRQSKFSVLGQASQGTYNLPRRDTRLLDAMALSGGIPQTNIRYIYIMRHRKPIAKSTTGSPARATESIQPLAAPAPTPVTKVPTTPAMERKITPTPIPVPEPAAAPTALEQALRELESGLPKPDKPQPTTKPAKSAVEQTLPAPSIMMRFSQSGSRVVAAPAGKRNTTPFKWVYKDGKWVKISLASGRKLKPKPKPAKPGTVNRIDKPVSKKSQKTQETTTPEKVHPIPTGKDEKTQPAENKVVIGNAEKAEDPFDWKRAMRSDQVRIIAIDLDRLKKGDPRMNVVVRDDDVIYVPAPITGEFYMMGEVSRPGVYSLTGRKITIKQALAAAGNVGFAAWPSNSYLIRRIGNNQEQTIPIDIEKIFRGEEPDIFLKPEDVIAVGTHVAVPWLSAARGIVPRFEILFEYSRNFIPPLLGNEGRHSDRFKRW